MKNIILSYLFGTVEKQEQAIVKRKQGIEIVRYWEHEEVSFPIYQYV